MVKLPTLAKVEPSFLNLIKRLYPDSAELTHDDKFLIAMNSIWSTSASNTGHVNQPRFYKFNQRVQFDVIDSPSITVATDLSTVVQNRAQEIINQGQPIKLFWSGGIDSTLTASSILAELKHTDQIEVYHTCESIRENPYFYDYIKKFNVRTRMWSDEWVSPFDTQDLLVTGTSADEITGSLDRSFYDEYGTWLTQPWQVFFKTQQCNDSFITRCEQLFSESQSPITTVFDARWWFYFYIRHTNYARRDWDYNLENNFANNNIQFFNCNAFDSWVMLNKESLIGREYYHYKQPFKDAIYKYWDNQEFLVHKEKVNSPVSARWILKKMSKFNQQYLFIYKTNTGKYKPFKPSQYPFVSVNNTIAALEQIEHEI